MKAPDYTLTIQINVVGAFVYAVLLGGVLVLAVIGEACEQLGMSATGRERLSLG